MTKIAIEIKPTGEFCGNCDYLYRLEDCHHIGAVETAWCEIFGELEQENTGLITEKITRSPECVKAEIT